ncbi:putative membrane protein [Anaerosolibacter carboniphilus]|uniref:Putative membrane protein n=1 Tax=Anaerosolibacter carboniphilus TaxID=1417629 RepID=A0A841KWN1_9FIRM|nr:SHOCT domain-containing protein [Anaerosolibacter carboniphilus]MBB6217767.1 putative membrane protein [Anaerosolibacter carboniphilus]
MKDRLDRLKEYRTNGVITEDEYERKKADIIDNYEI